MLRVTNNNVVLVQVLDCWTLLTIGTVPSASWGRCCKQIPADVGCFWPRIKRIADDATSHDHICVLMLLLNAAMWFMWWWAGGRCVLGEGLSRLTWEWPDGRKEGRSMLFFPGPSVFMWLFSLFTHLFNLRPWTRGFPLLWVTSVNYSPKAPIPQKPLKSRATKCLPSLPARSIS